MFRWIERLLAGFGLLILLSLLVLLATFVTIPSRNTSLTHFDTIVLLGCPALLSGQPAPEQRSRVDEAVKEFGAGRASHMIISGGTSENQFVESQVMGALAEQQGVPPAAIILETKSQDTLQNIYFSHQIMQQKGWTSAEIVSSPSHLPRTGLILEHYSFRWKEHAAHWPPEFSFRRIAVVYTGEILETFIRRWTGYPASPFLPHHNAS